MKKSGILIGLMLSGWLLSAQTIKWDSTASKHTLTTWKEQIKYMQDRNRIGTETYDSSKLCLLNYAYKGIIDSETKRQELLKELFADTTHIVLSIDFVSFEILPYRIIKQRAKEAGLSYDPCERLKSHLDASIRIGMELVQLKWFYKGRAYYSKAIVSNEGFVYDHIGFMVTEEETEEVHNEMWADSLSFSDKEVGFMDLQTLKEEFSVFHGGLNPDAWEIAGIANLKTKQGHAAVVLYETFDHQIRCFVVVHSSCVYIDNCQLNFIDCDLKSGSQFYRSKDEKFKLLVRIEEDGRCALTCIKKEKNTGIEYGIILTNINKEE